MRWLIRILLTSALLLPAAAVTAQPGLDSASGGAGNAVAPARVSLQTDPSAHLGEWTCHDGATTIVLTLHHDGQLDLDHGEAQGRYVFEHGSEYSLLTVYRAAPEHALDAADAALVYVVQFLADNQMRLTAPQSPGLEMHCQRSGEPAEFEESDHRQQFLAWAMPLPDQQ